RRLGLQLQYGAAAVLALAVFLAWGLPANRATGGELLAAGLGRHVVGRSVGAMESHGGHFLLFLPFYVPMLVCGFFPWILYLPAGLWLAWRGRLGGVWGRALVLGWAAPFFMAMTLIQTKLPHYILPIWPALALAAGGAIAAARRGELEPAGRKWLKAGFWMFAFVAGGGAAFFFAAPWATPVPDFLGPAWIMGAILTGFLCWVAWRSRWGGRPAPAWGVAGWMLAAHVALAGLALPAVEAVKIGPRLAAELRRAAPGADVFCHGFAEPSLVFYLGQPPTQVVTKLETDEAVAAWARAGAKGVLVAPRKRLARLEQVVGPLGLKEAASVKGFNYSEGKWLDVVALMGGGGGARTEGTERRP
nr:hypothetical protein [Candidatus Brocadiia bacterium]